MEDTTGSASPSESLEIRQPSPVSVLESPLERERLLYKQVSADPQGSNTSEFPLFWNCSNKQIIFSSSETGTFDLMMKEVFSNFIK
jgi:hypothetical protein